MVWGRGSSRRIDSIHRQATNLSAVLGFNEPNHKQQADLSAQQAAAMWPRLERAAANGDARVLVSPAAAPCTRGAKKCRMDGNTKRCARVYFNMPWNDYVCGLYYNT